MDILLYEAALLQKGLIEILSGLREVSLYMSISVEDTLRILREVHPTTVIIGGSRNLQDRFIRSLLQLYPGLSIYLCPDNKDNNSQYLLTNCRSNRSVPLQNLLATVETVTASDGKETIHKKKP